MIFKPLNDHGAILVVHPIIFLSLHLPILQFSVRFFFFTTSGTQLLVRVDLLNLQKWGRIFCGT